MSAADLLQAPRPFGPWLPSTSGNILAPYRLAKGLGAILKNTADIGRITRWLAGVFRTHLLQGTALIRPQADVVRLLRRLTEDQRAGYEPFAAAGKAPAHKGWQTRDHATFDFADWLAQDGTFGFGLRADDRIMYCSLRCRVGRRPTRIVPPR